MKTIIDWGKKFFGSIKGTGFILAVIVVIVLLFVNSCQHKKADKLIEDLTTLNITNDLLTKNNKALDKSLKEESAWRITFENKAKLSEAEKLRLAEENGKLKKKLAGIPDWINNIPIDSSYKYLNQVAYPYLGERKYPFNEPQIKGIHKSYAQNLIYTILVDTLDSQLRNCEMTNAIKDTIVNSLNRTVKVMELQKVNTDKILGNYAQKEDLYIKENKKVKRHVIFYQITTGVAVIVALIIAL